MVDKKKAAIALGAVVIGAAGIYFATRVEAAPEDIHPIWRQGY